MFESNDTQAPKLSAKDKRTTYKTTREGASDSRMMKQVVRGLLVLSVIDSAGADSLRGDGGTAGVVAEPDVSCDSGYARAGSFDPDRQKPFCLTKGEVSGTLAGTAPGSTKRRRVCPSGWAWAGVMAPGTDHEKCLTAREVAEAATQKDLKGSPSAATHAIGQKTKKDRSDKPVAKAEEEEQVRVQGHVDVNIREYDAEGGMHMRAIKVPLDLTEKGHLDYSKPILKKLKINGLLLAREKIRREFGLPSAGTEESRERIADDGADYIKTISRDTNEGMAKAVEVADNSAAEEDAAERN